MIKMNNENSIKNQNRLPNTQINSINTTFTTLLTLQSNGTVAIQSYTTNKQMQSILESKSNYLQSSTPSAWTEGESLCLPITR